MTLCPLISVGCSAAVRSTSSTPFSLNRYSGSGKESWIMLSRLAGQSLRPPAPL